MVGRKIQCCKLDKRLKFLDRELISGAGLSCGIADGVENFGDALNTEVVEIFGIEPEFFEAPFAFLLVHENFEHHLSFIESANESGFGGGSV